MGVKRYWAKSDNTITNAYSADLVTRGTGSNMGASDILEVFSIYAQAGTSSFEKSRSLIKFNATASTDSIKYDRDNSVIPVSGNVSFYLRIYNAPHSSTLPKNYTMTVSAVSGSWQEGTGLDMDGYKDKGDSNWINRYSASSGHTAWSSEGGDYFTDASSSFTVSYDTGVEDIELNITTLVEQWISSSNNSQTALNMGSKEDEGLGVYLTSTYEAAARSYYTKKFFGRGTEFFFKRPCIEARWDSTIKDNRSNFFHSSSLATADENIYTLYLYNYFKGQLRNIPSIGGSGGKIYLSVFSGSADNTVPATGAIALYPDGTNVLAGSGITTVATGGFVSTGIYSASFCMTAAGLATNRLKTCFDVWFSGGHGQGCETIGAGQGTHFHTSSFPIYSVVASNEAPSEEYRTKIMNLKKVYRENETARFRVYTRTKDWSPNIYVKATEAAALDIVESGSYEVYRVVDDAKIVPYGTGSDLHTQMSYDVSGNYFDLDMQMLEPGYMYGVKFAYYNNSVGDWVEQPEVFKFRVESRQN